MQHTSQLLILYAPVAPELVKAAAIEHYAKLCLYVIFMYKFSNLSNMPRFLEVKTWKDEPDIVLTNLDALPEDVLERVFPLYPEYLEREPETLFPLINSGIVLATIVESSTHRGFTYNKLSDNDIWNSIAMMYEYNKEYEKAKMIFEKMIEQGASDSATLNNFAAVLLNQLINKGNIEDKDEEQFFRARDYMYKAFIFDAQGRPKNILHAANAPAYRNIIIFRNIESELYYNKGDLFTSFVIGWISVEMNLNRIWCRYLNNQNEDNNLKEKLLRYNAEEVIDHLYLHKIIDKPLRDDINKYRSLRNDLVHGTAIDVTNGDVQNIIQLGRRLYPIYQN